MNLARKALLSAFSSKLVSNREKNSVLLVKAVGGRTTDQFFSYTPSDQRDGLHQPNFKNSNWKTHPNLYLDEEFRLH